MAQTLKIEIKNTIIESALDLFSDSGFEMTTMAHVAHKSGISTGNIYRYFKDKNELFHIVIPNDFVKKLKALITERVKKGVENLTRPDLASTYNKISKDLTSFSVENRKRIIILLSRSSGTEYEHFFQDLVTLLVDLVIRHYSSVFPNVKISSEKRLCLRLIYQSFVGNLSEILKCGDERQTMALMNEYTKYHLAGLEALLSKVKDL